MGVRVDDGFEEGMEITIYYDPMISKLIVFGNTRDEAISKMLRAIKDYEVVGVETTLPFCSYAIDHEAFRSGNFSTKFVAEHFTDSEVLDAYFEDEAEIAKLFAVKYFNDHKRSGFYIADDEISKWKLNRN